MNRLLICFCYIPSQNIVLINQHNYGSGMFHRFICIQIVFIALLAPTLTNAWLVATYHGNNFNTGSYLNFFNDSIFAELTFKNDVYSEQTVDKNELIAWKISIYPNRQLSISSTDTLSYLKLASFSFDSNGKIVSWMLDAIPTNSCPSGYCPYQEELYTFGYSKKFGSIIYTRDQSIFEKNNLVTSSISNNPGAWSYYTVAVPTPSSISILTLGLFLIYYFRYNIKKIITFDWHH